MVDDNPVAGHFCIRAKNTRIALLNELEQQLDKIQGKTHGFPQGLRLAMEKILDAGPMDDKILTDWEAELEAGLCHPMSPASPSDHA